MYSHTHNQPPTPPQEDTMQITAQQVRDNAETIARALTECADPEATQYTDYACIEAMLNACGAQISPQP